MSQNDLVLSHSGLRQAHPRKQSRVKKRKEGKKQTNQGVLMDAFNWGGSKFAEKTCVFWQYTQCASTWCEKSRFERSGTIWTDANNLHERCKLSEWVELFLNIVQYLHQGISRTDISNRPTNGMQHPLSSMRFVVVFETAIEKKERKRKLRKRGRREEMQFWKGETQQNKKAR